uniref:Reverse transcriptase domain-containing protein n=1 Tax=Fagus sylvatica TaxID=28930 RepID=A0A2N9EI09_FAGSY
MGNSRFFNVESKSYELVHHVNELRIVERGQKHLSHVTMGLVTARWCHDILLEFATLPPDQNAFRSFREGNKVFFIQKQRNGKGRFVSVTVLGDTKGKGSVIIPEGRAAGGWRGFSQEINAILTLVATVVNQLRRQTPLHNVSEPQHGSNSSGDSRSFKDAVILGNKIPDILHASNSVRIDSRDCSEDNTDSVEIFLKVVVGYGPDNSWEVKWAGVVDKPSSITIQNTAPIVTNAVPIGPKVNTKPNFPNNTFKPEAPLIKPNLSAQACKTNTFVKIKDPKPAPNPRFIWKPREVAGKAVGEASGARNPNHVSIHSEEPESPHSDSSMVPISQIPPIAEVFQGCGAVTKTWGSSSEWFIDLCDGRRVRLPMDMHNPVADHDIETTQKLIQWVSSHQDEFDMGCEDDGSTWGSQELEDGSEHSKTMMIKSGIVESEEEMPIMVELAIEVPTAMEHDSGEEVKAFGRTPSEKVLRKLRGVGKVLGASFEGYERVLELLMDIEARHKQKQDGALCSCRPSRSGRKCCSELKGSNGASGGILLMWANVQGTMWTGVSRVQWGFGGILLMWAKRCVEKLEDAFGIYSVSCKFKNVADQKVWMYTGVYGPNADRERSLMWDELAGIRSWWGLPWCVGGDFNVVRFPSKRMGSVGFSPGMYEFSDFISDNGLIDIPLSGGNFTWLNNREMVSMSRIDRFLYIADWEEGFITIYQKRLVRLTSDHFPIMLECGSIPRGRQPFRFENMRLKADGFLEWVRNWWGSYQFSGFNGDKAPGLDGFSLAFFQQCWNVVRSEVLALCQEFHEYCHFERSLNATFVSLIPKKHGADEIKDFRPISLVGGMYKIIAKLLAIRLSVVLGKIISPSQNAFAKGRQILDFVLIANECLDSRLKEANPDMICKLDLEKAYDHVNWEFLLYLLQRRCGFSEKWRRWISFCISSVRFSILVNCNPRGFFQISRSIRQGDPLSPLLFVIIMEALSRLLDKASGVGLLSGFPVGREASDPLKISHLLFADDTLIFCEANPDSLTYLREAYPKLFRIARDKDACVTDNFQRQGDSIHWEVTFSRLAQDWEMESFLSFLEILYSVTITGIGEDKVCWQSSKAHIFQVPPRVAFFTWTAALGRILTAENLRRRRIILVSWYCMCKANGESVDHLLLHCVYAKELWDLVLAMFGMCWVMPGSVRELLAAWQGKMGKHPKHMIWRAVPHCVMWCLWRERNMRIFEDCEQHVDELKLLFLRTLFEWMASTRLFCFSNVLEFIDYCCF